VVTIQHGRQRARAVAQLLGRQHVFAAQQVNAARRGRTALDAVDVDRCSLRIAAHVDRDPAAALRRLPLVVGDALERGRRAAQQVGLHQIAHRQPAQQIARASLVARAERARRRQRSRLCRFGAVAELQQLVRIQRAIDPRQAAQKIGLAVGTGQRFEPGMSACRRHRAGCQRLQPPVPRHLAAGGGERPGGLDATDEDDRGRILRGIAGPGSSGSPCHHHHPDRKRDRRAPTGSMTFLSWRRPVRHGVVPIYGRLSGRQAGDLFPNSPE
jgi:hypothetical protein